MNYRSGKTRAARGALAVIEPGQSSEPGPAGVKAEHTGETIDSALLSVALLRVALELKKPNCAPLEQILEGVSMRMRLPLAELRSYLAGLGLDLLETR